MILTEDQVKRIIPQNLNFSEWTVLFNLNLPKYSIDTLERVSMFLAQCSHESLQFTKLQENLNYSVQGLLGVFPKYFKTTELATKYARKPIAIANYVYQNRNGNGNELSGDGWTYRGKGIIGLTFKNNYQAFASYMNKTLDETIVYLETKEGALFSGLYYWKINKLNLLSDSGDVINVTKRINGGVNGLQQRKDEYNRIISILK